GTGRAGRIDQLIPVHGDDQLRLFRHQPVIQQVDPPIGERPRASLAGVGNSGVVWQRVLSERFAQGEPRRSSFLLGVEVKHDSRIAAEARRGTTAVSPPYSLVLLLG